jgi:hypothetical protein
VPLYSMLVHLYFIQKLNGFASLPSVFISNVIGTNRNSFMSVGRLSL